MSIVSAAVALSSFLVFFVSAKWDLEHMSIADVSEKCTAFRVCAYIFGAIFANGRIVRGALTASNA